MSLPSQKTSTDFPFKHSGQPDDYGVSVGDYTVVQSNWDSRAIYNQTQINAIIAALQSIVDGDSGADNVKITPITGVTTLNNTIQEALEVLKTQINSAIVGTLPDRSIQAIKIALNQLTELEMANDMKKDITGGITAYNTFITQNNIIRLAKTSTGTANALVIDTSGTFDLTVDGNTLNIIPNLTNTSASTIALDGQTAKAIKKFDIDTDTYIDTLAEDLKKNTPVQLVWSLSNDFFILRPSGEGDDFKLTPLWGLSSPQATAPTLRITVTGKGWVTGIVNTNAATASVIKLVIDGVTVIPVSNNSNALATDSSIILLHRFDTNFEFWENNTLCQVFYLLE